MNKTLFGNGVSIVKPAPVRIVYDYISLVHAMKTRTPITLQRYDGHTFTGLLNSLAIESGCGKSWIVEISVEGKKYNFVVKSN